MTKNLAHHIVTEKVVHPFGREEVHLQIDTELPEEMMKLIAKGVKMIDVMMTESAVGQDQHRQIERNAKNLGREVVHVQSGQRRRINQFIHKRGQNHQRSCH